MPWLEGERRRDKWNRHDATKVCWVERRTEEGMIGGQWADNPYRCQPVFYLQRAPFDAHLPFGGSRNAGQSQPAICKIWISDSISFFFRDEAQLFFPYLLRSSFHVIVPDLTYPLLPSLYVLYSYVAYLSYSTCNTL